MNEVKTVAKWGLIVLGGWFVLQWLLNRFGGDAVNLGGGSVYPNYYAAPLVIPGSPVTGTYAPWAVYYGWNGRTRRGRR